MEKKDRELISYNKTSHEKISEKFVGKKFNRLTIIEIMGKTKIGRKLVAKALCDCGNYTEIVAHDVKRGKTKSCGCLKKEIDKNIMGKIKTKHGESFNSKEYRSWLHLNHIMKHKGIEVSKEWANKKNGYTNFIKDMGRKPGRLFTLKRIDKTKPFFKENCKWAPRGRMAEYFHETET